MVLCTKKKTIRKSTLYWEDYENGETFEYTIDTSSTASPRPFIFTYTTTASETPELQLSKEGVITAELDDENNCVNVTCIGGGVTTLYLTVDDKTISLVFNITDTAEGSEEDYTLSWRDYSDGDVIERTINTSGSTAPARPLVLYYETDSSEMPSIIVSDESVVTTRLLTDSKSISVSNIGAGTSTITLTIGDQSISLTINVTDIAAPSTASVESVTLNKSAATLNVNETLTLAATVLPSNATNKNVIWTSSKDSVATVSQDGVVTAKSAGTAIITVTTEDGSFTDTCEIIVTATIEEEGLVDSGTDSNGINWYFYETGLLKISGTGRMQDHSGTATIPWYSEKANITEIEISDGITHIGSRSFYNCISLEKVTIPNSVTSVGTYAFRNCSEMSIYAESGTYAQTYATENNIPFVNTKKEELKNIVVDPYGNTSVWCFDISVEGYTEDAIAYAAIYDENGKMLAVTSEDFVIDDVTTLIIPKSGVAGAAYAKIFVWKSNLNPVAFTQILDL